MGLYQLEYFSKHQLFRHFPQFHNTSSEIRNAVLVIHGEKAHSLLIYPNMIPSFLEPLYGGIRLLRQCTHF